MAVVGPNFELSPDLQSLLGSYDKIGFQATSLGKAIQIVNKMVHYSFCHQGSPLTIINLKRAWRLSDESLAEVESPHLVDPEVRASTRCTIFLGYTSNLMSSGLREIILYLVKYRHISAIVTTAGGIEEDFIKCLSDTYLGDFHLDGSTLRSKGMNRIGNLLVPNDNYCRFEDWVMPILDTLLAEQTQSQQTWSPSSIIRRLGAEINDERSVYYWAYKVWPFWFGSRALPADSIVERYPSFLSCAHRRLAG